MGSTNHPDLQKAKRDTFLCKLKKPSKSNIGCNSYKFESLMQDATDKLPIRFFHTAIVIGVGVSMR